MPQEDLFSAIDAHGFDVIGNSDAKAVADQEKARIAKRTEPPQPPTKDWWAEALCDACGAVVVGRECSIDITAYVVGVVYLVSDGVYVCEWCWCQKRNRRGKGRLVRRWDALSEKEKTSPTNARTADNRSRIADF